MTTYETVVVIGMGLWILIALGILFSLWRLGALLRQVRSPLSRATAVLGDAEERLRPVLRNAERATEDVNYIVSSLRADVGEVGGSMRRLSKATDRMVGMVEERVAEIGGLLKVVQEEAEETFFSTAAVLRGLRGGRASVRGRRRGRALGGDR